MRAIDLKSSTTSTTDGNWRHRAVPAMRYGFKVAIRTWRRIGDSDVQFLAASMAFMSMVSLVPLLAVSLSVFHAYGGTKIFLNWLEPLVLQSFIDSSGVQLSRDIIRSVDKIESGVLGIGGSLALLLTSTNVLLTLEKAVNRVWGIRDRKMSIRRILAYWVFLFAVPFFLAVVAGLIGSVDWKLLVSLPRVAIVSVVTFCGLFCVNLYVPRQKVRPLSALFSAFLASTSIALAQVFYIQVTGHLLRYNKIYGSLASVPIFLLWISLLWWIFFAGVALCATLESRTDED